jgi:hypothetical protein
VPKGDILQLKSRSRLEGCRRGGGDHVKIRRALNGRVDGGDANSIFSERPRYRAVSFAVPGYCEFPFLLY